MRPVSIIGIGQTPVAEHWGRSIRELGAEAAAAALHDADVTTVDALYVGNGYSASIGEQSHLGSLLADYAGLTGVEAFTVEAGDASGAAALRVGYMAIASGMAETVLVVGVEKMTEAIATARTRARSTSLDADFEVAQGATPTALAGMLMRRYMHEHNVDLSAFEGFSVNAHANGINNPHAMFRNKLRAGAFSNAPMIADPVNLFDGAPDGDGAAAVVLAASNTAADMVPKPVRIAASAVATDTFALQDRPDMLWFGAVAASTQAALAAANLTQDDISLFEIHDAFTVMCALSLEAAGFAERGQGWALAGGEDIALTGKIPLSTFGGLKSRGNPAGATGIYQAVEATLQLRGTAGENQVHGARAALLQNLGGVASTAITHILAV